MQRVLMLTCQYMPDVFGGAEKQCQRVSTGLAAQGHQVTVLTSTQQRPARGVVQEQGVRVQRLWVPVAPDLLGRWLPFSLWWTLQVLAWGWRHRGEYEVIHAHQGKFGAFVSTLLGRLVGKPVLIKIGNSEDDMDLRCLQRKLVVGPRMVRWVLGRRPLFVAISAVIECNLREFGCRDVLRIPNGVPDIRGLAAAATGESTSHPSTEAGPEFFYHGRIESIKRVDVLIQAFALMAAAWPHARLHIVGDGTALADAKQEAQRQANCQERIVFHGAQPDAVAFVQRFDIFVNASRAEGFSNSLLEALVLGKPMVSTPVSGASEAIEDGANGALSEGFEPASLAEAMARVARQWADEGTERAARTSRRLVDETFAMGRIVARYEALYPQLIATHLERQGATSASAQA